MKTSQKSALWSRKMLHDQSNGEQSLIPDWSRERYFAPFSGVVSNTASGALKFRQYRHSFEVLIITVMSSEPGIDRCWLSWCWIWLRLICIVLRFIVRTHRCIGFIIRWLNYWTCASILTAIVPKPLGFIWLVCLLFLLTKLSLRSKNDCLFIITNGF
mgnify:FL=1